MDFGKPLGELFLRNEINVAFFKASVQIHRVKKGSSAQKTSPKKLPIATSTTSRAFEEGGRFVIDLEKITEEWSNRVLFDVEEQNSDWLESDHSDELARKNLEKLQYSADDGFPEVLDLNEVICILDEPMVTEDENYEEENEKYLASLGEEKINELKMEITEKIDKNTIAFLKERYKKNHNAADSKPKVSKFKASRANATSQKSSSTEDSKTSVPEPPPEPPAVKDMLDQLEVLEEFADRKDEEKYNRLATDAFQLDFTTKCLRSVAPRQQKNALKLFDNCKIATTSNADSLVELARSRIDEIKELYLEEV
ncbi:RPAP1-like protein [Teladorsagia circumcincta]|uniref:RPAP1-like protein n=1 Tax=Teladorsagia circumcincta TaxID=45464 RepID=A0A2G9UNA8_TELCI|nr:RPAP1-like protein [Teladorsagia circumcincta]